MNKKNNMNKKSNISHEDLIANLKSLVKSIKNYKGNWYEARSTKKGIKYGWSPPVVYRALKFLYDNELNIIFDWASWDEGREFFKNDDPNKYNSLDREWILKLLTAVARNDRFCDGAWASLFESGSGKKLFVRLLEIEESI
jgi:hypothetical protein